MERPAALEELSEASLETALRRRDEVRLGVLVERIERYRHRDGCFGRALRRDGLSVIAEYKSASPTEGSIREASPDEVA